MKQPDVSLLKRLVEIRFKMKELEEEIDEDITRYWKLALDRNSMIQRYAEYGDDSTGQRIFYDNTLKEYAERREIKQKTLTDMKKLYEEI